MGGPVGSPYPGTPVMIVFATFLALIVGRLLFVARKRRMDLTTYRNAGWQTYMGLAIFAACMLAMVLWAIWIAATRGVPT